MINEMLQYLADNDVYIGWAAWAAGPCKLEPFLCNFIDPELLHSLGNFLFLLR